MEAPGGAPTAGADTRRWVGALDDASDSAVFVLAGLLLVFMGILDWHTGPHLSFSIFYLLPVSAVAWRIGAPAGYVWALAAALIWLGIESLERPDLSRGLLTWNAGVRLGFFAIVAGSLAGIRRLLESERALAGTDFTTGVLNGRAFHDLIELERTRMLRYHRPFTLAYMDLDQFKAVNDQLGHSEGDAVLRLVASTVRENIRSMDSVARLGGDEFGILLPETGPGAAETALQKIQRRIRDALAEHGIELTASIGAVICVGPPGSVDDLIRRADELMYEVKKSGRNDFRCAVVDDSYGIEAILHRS
jgi:diguanylate cyclase (GGDEF)-like protein